MSEEATRSNEVINIKVVSLQNIRGIKGDAATVGVKVEFRDKTLGESPKCDCTLEQPTELDWSVNMMVNFEDTALLEDLTYRPIILTVTEILPKEKKQKDDKSQILGQCTFDLLPLFRGSTSFENKFRLNSFPGSPFESLTSEMPQPTIGVKVSCEQPFITEESMDTTNIMTVTMESLYSPPEAFMPGVAGINYMAAFSLPATDEKENVLVFPSGSVKAGGEKDANAKKLKWIISGSAGGESVYIPNGVRSSDDYDNEDGELKDRTSIQFRVQSEKEKNKVMWNMRRSTLLKNESIKILQSRIAKLHKWPVEIFRVGGSSTAGASGTGSKTAAGRKFSNVHQMLPEHIPKKSPSKTREEDSSVNFHGYAFVNMAPLLFPGVKRIRGAYKVQAFNESDYAQMTERKVGSSDEAVRIANTMLHQGSGSMAPGKKGAADKKPEKKGGKVPGSSMGEHPPISESHLDPSSTSGAVLDGSQGAGQSQAPSVPQNIEGAQYEEAGSYIMLEIELDRPLVRERLLEEVEASVAELIPPRDPMQKKGGSADKALDDYHNQIAAISKQLLTEFRKLFDEELKDPDILNNQDAVEQMRQELIYDLNSSGKYFAFKEQLKYAVIKIVREKCLHTSTITDQAELQEFLRTLFVYLVDELQVGLKRVISLQESPDQAQTSEEDSNNYTSNDQLLQFAKEAQTNRDYEWADRYYRERLARNNNSPEFWLDYGIYLWSRVNDQSDEGDECFAEAEHAFKKCVEISRQDLYGLTLCGLVCALQNRLEEADKLLEAVTTYHPKSIYAWTCRALFYNSIGNEIHYNMSLQEAEKLNNQSAGNKKQPEQPTDQSGPELSLQKVGETNEELAEGASARQSLDDMQPGSERTQGGDGTVGGPAIGQEEGGSVTTPAHEELQESVVNETIASQADNSNERRGTLVNTTTPRDHKQSVVSMAKSGAISKVTTSPNQKSKDNESSEPAPFVNNESELPKSVYMKTAEILFEQKAYAYVEKALAQELVYQASQRQQVTSKEEEKCTLTRTAEYNLLLGKLELARNHYEPAEAALLETVQIQFDNAEAWSEFGHLKFFVGDIDAAESFYKRSLSLTTDIVEPHTVLMRLASIYLTKEMFTEAKQTFLLACKKNPTCLSWLGVGVACYRLDELDESEEALAEANILNNENPEVWGYLSLICLKSGRKVEAEQSYKYSLRMNLEEVASNVLEEIRVLQDEVGFGNPDI